jgi:iron complex outermembrane receptor protein
MHGLNNKLYTELTFFTQISNLLVARRTAEDQYIGINAGESSHVGIEYVLNQLIKRLNGNLVLIFPEQ